VSNFRALASSVADAATFTVPYPDGRDAGSYEFGVDNLVVSPTYGTLRDGGDVAFALGTSVITITNNTGAALAAGTLMWVQVERVNATDTPTPAGDRVSNMSLVAISLGAPDAIDVNGICEAQSDTGAHTLTLDGDLVVDGVAVLDCPRNVIIDSGGADTAVLTISGFDEYGIAMSEALTLNGTTAVPGKKAFKRITSVTSSATIANGAFVGTGDVLGLPVFLSDVGLVMKEMQDGVAATAGTLLKGVTTAATTTTGDVRGTYDPNATTDGTKRFTLVAAIGNPGYKGVAQA
jgi:hypothetical protein